MVQFLREIECIKFVCNKFVLVLVQIDLIKFKFIQIVLEQSVLKVIISNCIRSICNKTNTNLLHTNSIHSILRKIGHTPKKSKVGKETDPPLSAGMREYVESVLRRKKMIPYKHYVHKKHVESILGTRKNMTEKCIQFE
jgi:hypothetical protein